MKKNCFGWCNGVELRSRSVLAVSICESIKHARTLSRKSAFHPTRCRRFRCIVNTIHGAWLHIMRRTQRRLKMSRLFTFLIYQTISFRCHIVLEQSATKFNKDVESVKHKTKSTSPEEQRIETRDLVKIATTIIRHV